VSKIGVSAFACQSQPRNCHVSFWALPPPVPLPTPFFQCRNFASRLSVRRILEFTAVPTNPATFLKFSQRFGSLGPPALPFVRSFASALFRPMLRLFLYPVKGTQSLFGCLRREEKIKDFCSNVHDNEQKRLLWLDNTDRHKIALWTFVALGQNF
jgi:hypothetical protein